MTSTFDEGHSSKQYKLIKYDDKLCYIIYELRCTAWKSVSRTTAINKSVLLLFFFYNALLPPEVHILCALNSMRRNEMS